MRQLTTQLKLCDESWQSKGKAYHELRMALPEDIRARIPPLLLILQERKQQNNEITVVTIPEVRHSTFHWKTLPVIFYTSFIRYLSVCNFHHFETKHSNTLTKPNVLKYDKHQDKIIQSEMM